MNEGPELIEAIICHRKALDRITDVIMSHGRDLKSRIELEALITEREEMIAVNRQAEFDGYKRLPNQGIEFTWLADRMRAIAKGDEGRTMEDVTLSWPGSMTTEQAKKYLLTAGFVAVELFRQQIAQSETQHQHELCHLCALSGRHSLYPDCNFCPVCGMQLRMPKKEEE